MITYEKVKYLRPEKNFVRSSQVWELFFELDN